MLPKSDDLSLTATACFLATAQEMMLETLQDAWKKGLNGQQLLEYWHNLMEPTGARNHREAFFTKVVERANSVSRFTFFRLSPLSTLADEIGGSPPN